MNFNKMCVNDDGRALVFTYFISRLKLPKPQHGATTKIAEKQINK